MAGRRGVSFRPRQIDVNTKLDVNPEGFDVNDETLGTTRGVPMLPTGMDAEEEKEKGIASILAPTSASDAAKAPAPQVIQTPMSRWVEDYNTIYTHPYASKLRVMWMKSRDPEDQEVPEYDADSEDEKWLQSISSKCRGVTEKDLIWAYETAVDRMEKLIRESKKMCSFEEAEKVISPFLKPGVVKDIYDFFIAKRQRIGVSLIRRFQIPRTHSGVAIGVTTRGGAARRKVLHQNDVEAYMKLVDLRDDFVRARELLSKILKREELKQKALEMNQGVFELNVQESQLPKPPPGSVAHDLKITLREKAKARARKDRETQRAKARKERKLAGDQGSSSALFPEEGERAESSSSAEIVSEYYSSEMEDAPPRSTFYDQQYAQYQRNDRPALQARGASSARADRQFRVGRGGRVIVDWIPDLPAYERGYNDDEVIIGWDSLMEARFLDEHPVPTSTSTLPSQKAMAKPATNTALAQPADSGDMSDMPVSAMIFKRRALLQAQNKAKEEAEESAAAVAAVAAASANMVTEPHPAAATPMNM